MTTEKESRPARRARERRETKRPGFVKSLASRSFFIAAAGRAPNRMQPQPEAATPEEPKTQITTRYLLFCRVEDDDGEGFHVITGADSLEEGDWLTREMQPMVRTKLSMGS